MKNAIARLVNAIRPARFWHLTLLWLVVAAIDRLWLAVDGGVPDWDRADYLTGTLNYWSALQFPEWLSLDWWTNLWLLSSKIPPLTYIATAPFYNLFNTASDTALLLNLVCSGVLIYSVFQLGKQLFTPQVGVWAAVLCLLFPGLVAVRLHFLLDYPLVTATTLVFYTLTRWRFSHRHAELWTIALSISLGLGILVKQSIALFLFFPFLWTLAALLRDRQWTKLLQFILASLASTLLWGWWYRANWILVLTGSKRATVDSAIAEGDPALDTLAAWTYYLRHLPHPISWVLLLGALSGFLLLGAKHLLKPIFRVPPAPPSTPHAWRWLAVFLIGGYLLSSLNINKDPRYLLPLLPVFSLVLAYGLMGWGWRVRWGIVSLAALLLAVQLRPTTTFFPGSTRAYVGEPFPHRQVIDAITEATPYLQSTLGVLPSTPTVNQHNLNYYGALANFQVYGRQVGVREADLQKDARSLPWFVTKTGDPGSVPDTYAAMVALVENGEEFELYDRWLLPDGDTLKLYRRRQPLVEVTAEETRTVSPPLRLESVTLPSRFPPGSPVPITYRWSGGDRDLRELVLLVRWLQTNGSGFWLHDRAIADGRVIPSPTAGNQVCQTNPDRCTFSVSETTAMLPPAETPPGTYRLEVQVLDPLTGLIADVDAPAVSVVLDPNASVVPAPELDLVTQLRQLARALPQGTEALDGLFAEIARINQYDPVQDYLNVAVAALEARLRQFRDRPDWAYAVGLAWALQTRPQPAIAAFDRVVELDPNNPYAYGYLGLVNLADWRPQAAQQAIDRGRAIAPELPELQLLDGVASLMRGRFGEGIDRVRSALMRLEN